MTLPLELAALLIVTPLVTLVSWIAVGVVRRYAAKHLLDIPNERSSHAGLIPRGGGLGLVLVHMSTVVVAWSIGAINGTVTVALIGGGALVSAVGFIDDHRHIPASARLFIHLLSVVWVAWCFGGLPRTDFGWGEVDLGVLGTLLLVVYLVWFLNLFNFMDGIDGIAATQALSMAATASLLLGAGTGGTVAALPLLMLAAATAGFLIWNWPPAKIFMGDVGSGYLGFSLGVLALWTVVQGWLTVWVWLILGGAFLADATVTLLVRAHAGATLAEAHRSHAYQRLSRRWGSHRSVTLGYLAVNLFWLFPWAWLAASRPHLGAACAVAALVPLFVLAVRLGAGQPGEMGSEL